MIRCLRKLNSKITNKLTNEEWDIVGERVHEYANNSYKCGIFIGVIAVSLIAFICELIAKYV